MKHSGAQVKRLIKTDNMQLVFRSFWTLFLSTRPCCSVFLPYIIVSRCVVFPLAADASLCLCFSASCDSAAYRAGM